MVGNDGRTGPSIGRLRAAALLAAMGVLAPVVQARTLEQPSTAQEVSQARRFLTITSPETLVRCAAGSYYYPVRKLEAGDVVVGLGVDNEWVRIEYPEGATAYVGADVATRSGDSVRLTEASRLKAANLNYGLRGSWKAIFEEPLAAGTALRLIEVSQADDGSVAAYLVEAPAGSVGYVHDSSVRESTPEEVARFKSSKLPETKKGSESSEPAGSDEVVETPVGKVTPQEQVPAGPGASESGAATPTAEPGAITDAQVPPAEDGAGEALSIDQSDQTPDWAPDEMPAGEGIEGPDAAANRPVATPAALDEAFRTVYAQSVFDAEYDELIAEIQRAMEAVDISTPEGQRLKRQLATRIDLLELKRDVQYEQRALAEATKKIDEKAAKLAEQLSALERTQSYTIVGRLVPSTVYDGQRLPLMYRIQSVGQAVPRTLGYVRPGTGLNIDTKLGEVVGVVGEASLDKSLKLRVVQPQRVDVLAPAPEVTVPEEVTVSAPEDGG